MDFVGSNKSGQTIFIDHQNKQIMICDVCNLTDINKINDLKLISSNDRYSKSVGQANVNIEVTTISPYAEQDLIKFQEKKYIMFEETADFYNNNIYPKILAYDKMWLLQILNGTCEASQIIYQNSDFILIPDITMQSKTYMNNKDLKTMHYLAIVKRCDIFSLRDLDETHLDLLQLIDDIGRNEIAKYHDISPKMIRSYVHYRPSFWHLHIHFDLIGTNNTFACLDYCHLIHNIIHNIKLFSEYYKKTTLRVAISE